MKSALKTVWLAALFASCLTAASALELDSPNGSLAVFFELKDLGATQACPVYRVVFQGRTVIADSRLGLELASGPLNEGLRIVRQTASQHDTTWKPVCAERETIRDRYRQVVIDLQETKAPQRILQLTFRAYDEGVAFCYTLPEQEAVKNFTITRENTQFAFTGDHTAWAVYSAQGNYLNSEVPLSKIKPGAERPLTVHVADDIYVSVTEARLVNYARMKLRSALDQPHTMEAFLDAERGQYGAVTGTAPFTSPWRVIMAANSPGKLLEQNYLILNLNDPCALKDTSWIKPGKVLRETSLTTAGGKACVDFAAQQGLQFIEYDAGWYGPESDSTSDAREVHLDPKRNPNPDSLNIREVIAYATSKGIGVILYVNHLALERQLDEILPLYRKWGVKGVKYGFVNVGSQRWTQWLHEAIRKAAEHQLMVDIHDEFRSTGYQRTYPNLMTVEGVLGNEGFPTPVHNATLPFTRYLTGPGDYTFCWSNGRLKSTHAHQLAISTIFFSPWQFLYWYDRPSMVKGEKALEYWKHLPTVWDETRVLKGEIGQCVSIARRQGREWHLGTLNTTGRGPVEIPLDFLESDTPYTATIYSDQNPANPESKDVKVETMTVNATTILKADMPFNGGQAARFVPAETKLAADAPPSKASFRFRAMTYNIHHGEGTDGKVDLQRIADLIRQEQADLVALQEVDKGVRRTQQRDFPSELAALTGMTCVFSNNFHYQGGEYGNAVLSRFPVLGWTNTCYRMLRTNEQRGVLQVSVRVADQPLVFMATHLDFRPDDAERRLNAEQLAEILDRYPGLTVIAGGDFNDVPNNRLHRKMKERWQDVWEKIGANEGFTITSERPTKRIDYLWITPDSPWIPRRAWVPASNASDHLPVVVEFERR